MVLGAAVFIWSMMTIGTPPAARFGLGALYAARFFMGLGEGMSLPTIHQLCAAWTCSIPAYKSRFITFVSSGMFMGTVVAMGASPLAARSWAQMFYLFGGLGIGWCGAWTIFGRSYPPTYGAQADKWEAEVAIADIDRAFQEDAVFDSDGMSSMAVSGEADAKRSSSRGSRSPGTSSGASSPASGNGRRKRGCRRTCGRFFGHRGLVVIYYTHFTSNWLHYLLISWLPTFTTDGSK